MTDDLDLLDLMEPQSSAGIDFRSCFPGVRILTPIEFEGLMAQAAP